MKNTITLSQCDIEKLVIKALGFGEFQKSGAMVNWHITKVRALPPGSEHILPPPEYNYDAVSIGATVTKLD